MLAIVALAVVCVDFCAIAFGFVPLSVLPAASVQRRQALDCFFGAAATSLKLVCSVPTVMVRATVLASFLLPLAAALVASPVVVQYDASPSLADLSPGRESFESRFARLVHDVDRADVLLSALGPPAGSSSSFLSETPEFSAHELQAAFPNATFTHAGVVMSSAISNALAAEGLRGVDADHARDYNAPCPLAWIDRGDGDACDAPASYEGPCGGTLHFGGLAAHEKINLANSCGVVFPSVGVCAADFSKPCPVDWRVGDAGWCTAPVGYAGPCVRRKNFASLAAGDKAWFESVCGVKWPCRASWYSSLQPIAADACEEDFSNPCPHAWTEHSVICLARADYDGLCSVAWAAADYTIEEKRVVSRNCGAAWPCGA